MELEQLFRGMASPLVEAIQVLRDREEIDLLGQPAQSRKQLVSTVRRRRQRQVAPVRVEHPHERRVRLKGVRRREINRRVVSPGDSTHIFVISVVISCPVPVRTEPGRHREPGPNQRQHCDPALPAGFLSEKFPERVCLIHVAYAASNMPLISCMLFFAPLFFLLLLTFHRFFNRSGKHVGR